MVQRMSIVIKKFRNILSCGCLMFLFLIRVQAQVAYDVVVYQSPLHALYVQGTHGDSKKDSSKIISHTTALPAKLSASAAALLKTFEVFGALKPNEVYQITLAADVPDDKRPAKVFYKKEPGHVFIILEQKDTLNGNVVAQSWGFYPKYPVSSLFVRTIKCKLQDNGNRLYDAAITKQLTKEEFETVQLQALLLTAKKYHLNKYNCYDYAVEIFNTVAGEKKIPFVKVKFPFVFGWGSSPCGLYSQLQQLKESGSMKGIAIAKTKSPTSSFFIPAKK
jgi:hypothetical protein